jgi:glycosyltransferase involved in cell wall biosynthesis
LQIPSGKLPGTRQDSQMPGKILMIAFHYPPQAGSSGYLRTLKFSRYLPENNWIPTVLTAHPRAYSSTNCEQLKEIPREVQVLRAFALDTKKHLSISGKYFPYMALPDRWVSWSLGAVPCGIRAIRRKRIDVIFSTYPIATAIMTGYWIHLATGCPWVVDLRDSMTEEHYPNNPTLRRVYRWIERKAAASASMIVFTASATRRMYLERYPHLSPDRCIVIPNGYDEEDFGTLDSETVNISKSNARLRLLHVGLLYPKERDPLPFFRAVKSLQSESNDLGKTMVVELRAPGSESHYQGIIEELGLGDVIHILPALPYHESLAYATGADVLLLFQAACCNQHAAIIRSRRKCTNISACRSLFLQ